MIITNKTIVFDIIDQYGDIAEVMEAFGIKRVGKYSVRRIITRGLTVQMAAKIHRVPVDKFIDILNKAISIKK
jgi:hypothetical protein